MIKKSCFTEEWILKVKGKERNDPSVIEKQIYALHLLEELNLVFDEFIFKGGTSLSLLVDDFPRFSVDIDILVDPKNKNVFTIENLQKVIDNSLFKRIEENVRQPKHNIDKQHFEFYYDGVYGKETFILLDVAYGLNHYSDVQKVKISNYLLEVIKDISEVSVPSVHDFIADKLGAFAPNTIGKKIGEDRDVEVIKQMYDVSFFMKHYSLKPSFEKIYIKMATSEIISRGLDCDYKDTLYDTIRTSSNIVVEGKLNTNQYKLLKVAIRKFSSFVKDYNFNVESSKNCAIYSMYASLLVLSGGKQKFDNNVKKLTMYPNSYRVFKPVMKGLRRTNNQVFVILEECLLVMSSLGITL